MTFREEKKFRYLFQGTKGDPQNSSGGIYLDDITLTETPCPTGVWTVRNFSQVLQNTVKGDKLQSPRFYNSEGYGLGLSLYPQGRTSSGSSGYLGLTFHLCSGENDAVLEWPVENRQVIMTILDQEADVRKRMSSSMVFTTSKTQTSTGRWLEELHLHLERPTDPVPVCVGEINFLLTLPSWAHIGISTAAAAAAAKTTMPEIDS